MGWQPGATRGSGEESGREPLLSPSPDRDGLLAGFARGGAWDGCPPSAALAAVAEAASGPEWRCPGATDDELAGVLRRWAAIEAWAAAGRLGVIREMIRREGPPAPGGGWHGDLPDAWGESQTCYMPATATIRAATTGATTGRTTLDHRNARRRRLRDQRPSPMSKPSYRD